MCAAAAAVTVSADVEKITVDEMRTPAAGAPSDVGMTDVDRRAADSKPQHPAAEPATAGGSTSKQPPAPAEPSRKVLEGDVVKLSEETQREDVLNDGTTVKTKTTTTKHVQPITTIVRQLGTVEEQSTVDKLLGTETDEEVLVLEPGVLQRTDDQLENETQVEESEDALEDGTWLRRKVTTVTVRCRKTPSAGRAAPPVDDQSTASQSKPSIVPVKLTKLEPLSKDRPAGVTADADQRQATTTADIEEQKRSTDEPDTTRHRSGSPSLSVVRLTKLEPLSFERANGGTVPDQRGPDVLGQPADQSGVVAPSSEDMIVPIPSSSQRRGRPAWLPTTQDDDDLELRAADVDEATIQVERSAEQFAVAPTSNIKPADEQQITETLASTPGQLARV